MTSETPFIKEGGQGGLPKVPIHTQNPQQQTSASSQPADNSKK